MMDDQNGLVGLTPIEEENINQVIEEQGAGAVCSDELIEDKPVYEDFTAEAPSSTSDYSSESESTGVLNNEVDEENKDEEDSSKKGNSLLIELLDWFKSICIGLIVGVLVVVFIIQRSNVHGDSMNSTLTDGDVILAEKVSTYFDSFERGDIVILDGHDMEGYMREEYLIKRIIGLPGETVKFEDGYVYIMQVGSTEFMRLEEPYLDPGTITNVSPRGIENGYECYTLGEEEYFCLGDNRGVSNDSRNLGPFTSNRIKGVAVVRVFPFDSIRTL
ncbi:MAG: signal peptidase I [Clostridia bacterium]|nr:signal peptidase I [Clostridia bacterium]